MTEIKEKSTEHLAAALDNMPDYYVGYFTGITERLAMESKAREEEKKENVEETLHN